MKKNAKRLLVAVAVCTVLSVCVGLVVSSAANSSGSCGKNATYSFSSETLTVSGSGDMNSYSENTAPWAAYRNRIKKVVVSDGITSVGYNAFAGSAELAEVSLPSSVTSVGRFAFANCPKLSIITLPSGLKKLGSHAFLNCSSLTSVAVPEGVVSLSPSVFDGCSSLSSVSLPTSLKTVGASAFEDCTSLAALAVPDNVETLGAYAFAGCTSLSSLRLHSAAKNFGDSLFDGCSSSLVVTCPKGSAADAFCASLNITVSHEGLSEGGTDPDPGEWNPWF